MFPALQSSSNKYKFVQYYFVQPYLSPPLYNRFVTCVRWSKLKAALVAKRNKLGESQSLQQFNRDADEVETWMLEKMQTASDESYKDPTNLQVSIIIIISDSQKI